MRIIINGEAEEINEAELTVSRLLSIKNVESPDMVSVQVNDNIVDRADYDHKQINPDDEVEFLYFMGGGAFS
ncbi:MAG TPA: sulfur carrier protein ThiS [Desulfobacterales bacterium]|uniref:Sulfur carrier protein ThiS n=1 Tax=hydrothermal vent metagenome TaxID=652676 RepID=A0A3B0W706_9ZZZZ|nr:sulfur carrier protein ThiS [Desulfobacterales bacterium]